MCPAVPRITVRRATVRDLEHLVRQRRAMWADMGIGTARELDDADRVYRRWARERLRSKELMAWVAEADVARGARDLGARGRNARVVVGGGALWLQPVQPRPGWAKGITPYLLSMYTDQAWRGRGIARRIVREAIRWARDHGYPRMTLHASDAGRPIYAALGFKDTREMKRQLRPEAVTRPARSRRRSRRTRTA